MLKWILLVAVSVVSGSSAAGISDDEMALKLVALCNNVFHDKGNASFVYQADVQRFSQVYRLRQQDVNQRYSREDANKLWASALYFAISAKPKKSAHEQVSDCRSFTDSELDFFDGVRALGR